MDITKYYAIEGEKPLDTIKPDGGFTSVFRTIACIGDSLSSGEFESIDPATGGKNYHDMIEYSWGQYIARAAGVKVYNFSAGGMTARVYMGGWADGMGCFDPAKAAQAYILALGVNDIINGHMEIGSASDICLDDPSKNKPTFAGQFGSIIQKYKTIQPQARFFLVTMPRESEFLWDPNDKLREEHAKLLHQLAKLFDNTYVIDLYEYAPVYDEDFKRNFYLGGHLNAAGYVLTAQMVMSYIDYIIRNNPDDFTQVSFIGTPMYNESL